jgi:uncharacterized protein YndB with AHSA1/START domain
MSNTDTTSTDYRRTVTLDAPPEQVFELLATLDGLREWWSDADVTGDAAAGGDVRLEFPGHGYCVLHVDESAAPSLVRWTCTENSMMPEWLGTSPTFEVVDTGDGRTRLTVHHVGLVPDFECYDQCHEGWDAKAVTIAGRVESGQSTPSAS